PDHRDRTDPPPSCPAPRPEPAPPAARDPNDPTPPPTPPAGSPPPSRPAAAETGHEPAAMPAAASPQPTTPHSHPHSHPHPHLMIGGSGPAGRNRAAQISVARDAPSPAAEMTPRRPIPADRRGTSGGTGITSRGGSDGRLAESGPGRVRGPGRGPHS